MEAPQNQLSKQYYWTVEELLKNTINGHQLNDFHLLTIPDGHSKAGKGVPVDYKLKELVLYFWKNNFITCGWNQGYDDIRETPIYREETDQWLQNNKAFISFKGVLTNGGDAYDCLKKILYDNFGADNINIINLDDFPNFRKADDKIKNYIINEPNKLVLEIYGKYIFLVFNKSFIESMHCAL